MRKLFGQHPNADTELRLHDPIRAAGRDDPLGAVHRRARQSGHAVAVPALSGRAALARATDRGARAADPADRLLPRKVAVARRHGEGGGRSACRRDSDDDGRAGKLPGVGRKTANVVLGHALGVPGLPVDRHVLRVANRIGLASRGSRNRRAAVGAAMPPDDWTLTSDSLILHGRRICKPRPLCDAAWSATTATTTARRLAPCRRRRRRSERRSRSIKGQGWYPADRSESGSLMKLPRAAKPEHQGPGVDPAESF